MRRREPEVGDQAPEFNGFLEFMRPDLQFANSMLSPILSANIAMLNWNAKCCERLAQGYKQWFDFLGHRLEEDASLAEKMQSAQDPTEFAQACSSFVEKAAKDYRAEFSELTKLTDEMSNDASDALQDLSISPEVGAVSGE